MSRRGLNLIELVVSAILTVIVTLVVASTSVSLQRTSATTAMRAELDESARRILEPLRRELRQSGSVGAVDQISSPPAPGTSSTLEFKIRTGLGLDAVADWSTPIRYRLEPDGSFRGVAGDPPRFLLSRTESGQRVIVARELASLSFQRSAGEGCVLVSLELMKPNPRWDRDTPPPPLRRVVHERLVCLNE